MKVFRKKKEDLTVLECKSKYCYYDDDSMVINKITQDMINKEYQEVAVVPIQNGFIPVEKGYTTRFTFDTSELTLFRIFRNIPSAGGFNTEYLVLKGLLNYVVTLEQFRPSLLSMSGETTDTTVFSYRGVIPVNCVLAAGDINQYSNTEFTIDVCKLKQYITGIDRVISIKDKMFYKVISNPDISKNVNVPFVVSFKPKKVTLFQEGAPNDDPVDPPAVIDALINLVLISTLPDTNSFEYRPGYPLIFNTSIDGHTLEYVVNIGINPITLQRQYQISLVGNLFYNTTLQNLYSLSSNIENCPASFSVPGVTFINVNIGTVDTIQEVLEILRNEPQIIVSEINVFATLENGDVIQLDPSNPEAFYELFNGMNNTRFQVFTVVTIIPTPIPLS